MPFVYKITNTVNDKFFVGISRGKYTPNKLFWLKTNVNSVHCNRKLKPDVIAYGREKFKLSIVKETNDENELMKVYHECFPVDYHRYEQSYNIDIVFHQPTFHAKSTETKLKMSVAKKGVICSDEIKRNRAEGQQRRIDRLKEAGLPCNWASCLPYLIFFNNGWHYFPVMPMGKIGNVMGFNLAYVLDLYKSKLNTGESLNCKTKRFRSIIIYNNPELIEVILETQTVTEYSYT